MPERTKPSGGRRWVGAVAAAAIVLALAGAGAVAAPVTGGTLTIGLEADPTMLDPHASAAAATYLLGSLNVFESLLYQSPDGKFNPWLATSYRISPDGKTFTFVLRQDVRFSDGTPFNADAVKWNFDRIVNPNFRAGGALSSLVGYTGSTVVDDHTVQVNFKDPYAPFLSYVAGGTLAILSPKATAAQTAQQTQRAPVGSGPFTVTEYVTNTT